MSQPSEPLKVKQLTEPRGSEQMEFHPPSAPEPPRTMQSLLSNLLLWAHYPGQICGRFHCHKGWSLHFSAAGCAVGFKKKKVKIYSVFYTCAILSLFLTLYRCLEKRRTPWFELPRVLWTTISLLFSRLYFKKKYPFALGTVVCTSVVLNFVERKM